MIKYLMILLLFLVTTIVKAESVPVWTYQNNVECHLIQVKMNCIMQCVTTTGGIALAQINKGYCGEDIK